MPTSAGQRWSWFWLSQKRCHSASVSRFTRAVRFSMSAVQVSFGWGAMPSICRSADSFPSISERLAAISADSFPLVMKSVGSTRSGTSGTSIQKWYFATASQ